MSMPAENGAAQPLAGIRIIDFTQVMLGPCATQMLADYGADVIKIERPGAGDLSRSSIAEDPDGLDNPVFRSLNRNKRSLAIDLRSEAGKAVIYDLVKTADVVVNNFRAGVMERMGFGYAELAELNPRIISAFGSGFGQSGPLVAQGRSGRARPGPLGRDGAALQRGRAVLGLLHRPCRLFGRHASGAGGPAWPSSSARRRGAASRSRSRSTTRCWRCRCRRPPCGCSAGASSTGVLSP